jgi:hypothetical protein
MEFSYTAVSLNGVPIRLLAERWSYTNACCEDVLETIESPDLLFPGTRGARIAARRMTSGGYLLVTYREVSQREGLVISASIAINVDERRALWRSRRLSYPY